MVVGQAKPDVAVVGGGPIGLAAAWRAAQSGLRVTVLDAGEPGAWRVAAGMLAPVAESSFGEDALLELGLRAAAGFPAFAAELAEAAGEDPGLHRSGTLIVARDRDEAESLDRLLAFRRRLGLEVERLLPAAARRAEPALAPTVRLALDVAGDHSVDPRRLVAALRAAVRNAGGELRDGAPRRAGDRAPVCRSPAASASPRAPCSSPRAPVARRAPRAPCPCARSRARCCACATRAGPGLVDAHDPDARRLPGPPRRRPLRARRDDGGARLRHRADRRRRVRAAARPVRGRARRARARGRGAARRPAPGDARQPARDRPGASTASCWATGHHRNGILLAGLTGDARRRARCAASRCRTGPPPRRSRAASRAVAA